MFLSLNEIMRSLLSVFCIFLPFFLTSFAIACAPRDKNFFLDVVDRSMTIHADFARSVFRFRGGTAYYIGGSPGYFITNHHVWKENKGNQKDKVCSDFYSSEESCFDVNVDEDEVVQLKNEDMILFSLVKENDAFSRIRPFQLALVSLGNKRKYLSEVWVMGYPKKDFSQERIWSVESGIIDAEEKIVPAAFGGDIDAYPGFLNNNYYTISADQFKGASGGPVVNRFGMVVGTAVLGGPDGRKAVAIPHNEKFARWIVLNTSPSKKFTAVLNKVDELMKEVNSVSKIQNFLMLILDVRGDPIAGLDLLHLISRLSKDTNNYFRYAICPFNLTHGQLLNISWLDSSKKNRSLVFEQLARSSRAYADASKDIEVKSSYYDMASSFNAKAFATKINAIAEKEIISENEVRREDLASLLTLVKDNRKFNSSVYPTLSNYLSESKIDASLAFNSLGNSALFDTNSIASQKAQLEWVKSLESAEFKVEELAGVKESSIDKFKVQDVNPMTWTSSFIKFPFVATEKNVIVYDETNRPDLAKESYSETKGNGTIRWGPKDMSGAIILQNKTDILSP